MAPPPIAMITRANAMGESIFEDSKNGDNIEDVITSAAVEDPCDIFKAEATTNATIIINIPEKLPPDVIDPRRLVMGVAFKMLPKAPPAPVISKIGPESDIPFPIHPLICFSSNLGKSEKAQIVPSNKATKGLPIKIIKSANIPEISNNFIIDAIAIRKIGNTIGPNDLKADGKLVTSFNVSEISTELFSTFI